MQVNTVCMPESFKGWVIRTVVLAALCFSGAGCSSVERLFRNSPLSKAEVTADRVNVWPLYYKNGVQTAVLWPVFDDDDRGFALRPLITRDGSRWEVLPPLASWDAQGGDWTVLTAYRRGESHGFFPVYGVGDLSQAV